MKLYIKQSVFTLKEKFAVKNEDGLDVFYVEGSFMRIPKMFKIYDSKQNEVAIIERQMFRLMGHYDIKTLKKHITVRREFTLFKPSYRIEGLNWRLVGNFLARNYEVVVGERPIMNLSKHWFTWGDSYELDIKHSEDALLALCIVICIDYEMQTQANSANSAA